jgi:Flp pilus assembly pilin Flp
MEPLYNTGPQVGAAEIGVGLLLVILALVLIGLGLMIWM